ncbi:MAG: winged helix-turn-helix domain-containing protein [Thaumarchaeota archaeon]|nr:winged helix-turn-helix domain-containing protein [Candidatus Calditenuaceae archaeon]MDW8041952.1 winged helix-turn-helix domain-containing protein [Nitrososphaerota archaeon]
MRRSYRSKVRIYADIISSVLEQGEARVTAIMRDANLPYDRLQRYVDELCAKGLLTRRDAGGPLYSVTEKGSEFLTEFKKFERISRAYGIHL